MKRIRFTRQLSAALALAGLLSGAASCGPGEGPEQHQLSGEVKFGDKPIPKGTISFTPDSNAGNKGPGTVAEIKDGKYKTPPRKGIVGGAYLVTIQGYDGVPIPSGEGGEDPLGKPLFKPYEMKVELPEDGGTHNFQVPADAKK